MVRSVTWFLVVVFLIFFAATSPEAAANATHALWDLLVRLFNGLIRVCAKPGGRQLCRVRYF